MYMNLGTFLEAQLLSMENNVAISLLFVDRFGCSLWWLTDLEFDKEARP